MKQKDGKEKSDSETKRPLTADDMERLMGFRTFGIEC